MQDSRIDLNSAAGLALENGDYGPGALIAICGFDGSGKTTQLTALAEHFTASGHEVLTTRQPTTDYRNEPVVRQFLDNGGSADRARVLAVMAAADRHKHVHNVILPALREGKIVLCDRYLFSSLVYFEARGVAPGFVAQINRGIPKPDLSVFLDVPAETVMARLKRRDGDKLKYEERDVSKIAEMLSRFRSMTAHLSMIAGDAPPEQVTQAILACFETTEFAQEQRRTAPALDA